MISMAKYKTKKKYKRVLEDIDKILHIISLTERSLSYFKQYAPVQAMLVDVETNKNLLTLYRKKYESELEKVSQADTE